MHRERLPVFQGFHDLLDDGCRRRVQRRFSRIGMARRSVESTCHASGNQCGPQVSFHFYLTFPCVYHNIMVASSTDVVNGKLTTQRSVSSDLMKGSHLGNM